MFRNKIVRFKKIYKFYFDHFLIKCTVFVLILKKIYGKSSGTRECRDENVFLKSDRALSKLITLLISNKKEFNHFFKSRNSDIVLLILSNLHQNAKRYEARSTEREARRPLDRAPQARSFLRAKRSMKMCERIKQIFLFEI